MPSASPFPAQAASVPRTPERASPLTGAERRSWVVAWLCAVTALVEIAGGVWSGSIALVADGLHTSTHAAVLSMAALAYRYARRHRRDPRFAFGTGKVGDLAGFASGVVLAAVAVLIGWEAVGRMAAPVPIGFGSAIGLATLGLAVNLLSVWLLRGGAAPEGLTGPHRHLHRDHNMRAVLLHIAGDAAESILVICGLLGARASGALWLDPLAGMTSALMVLWLARVLLRDTGAVLLDMAPPGGHAERLRAALEATGDRVLDLHVWRTAPGQLSALVTVETRAPRGADEYRAVLLPLAPVAHMAVEVRRPPD